MDWGLFGQTGSLNFTVGALLWAVVFIMTGIINEYFGRRRVRCISFLTVWLIVYAFLLRAGYPKKSSSAANERK